MPALTLFFLDDAKMSSNTASAKMREVLLAYRNWRIDPVWQILVN